MKKPKFTEEQIPYALRAQCLSKGQHRETAVAIGKVMGHAWIQTTMRYARAVGRGQTAKSPGA